VAALAPAGYPVETPEMPWSARRAFDAGVERALDEVEAAVGRAQTRGARAVIVGGHGLGANAALAYAAARGGMIAVVMLAPDHLPDLPGVGGRVRESVERARTMVAGGHGAVRAGFDDVHRGVRRSIAMRAADYLSYYDPAGPAVLPLNASRLRHGVPVLWAVGEDDPVLAHGQGYAFDRAAGDPRSRYLVVGGGHDQTPRAAAPTVLAWLRMLESDRRP
jgi:acetyl esterase/lipase